MRTVRSIAAATLALTAVLVGSQVAEAQAATRFLEQRHERVNQILRQEASSDAARTRRSERLQTVLGDLLDYEALARAALADHWDDRSEAERSRFIELLQQLVRRNYESNLERIVDYEVSYEREGAGRRTHRRPYASALAHGAAPAPRGDRVHAPARRPAPTASSTSPRMR